MEKVKNLLKRIMCMLLAICIPQVSFSLTPLKVCAESARYRAEVRKLCEERPLEGYLYLQTKNHTGKFAEKFENKLNCAGVFDKEINDWTTEDIEDIENAEQIQVYTQYVEYTYTGINETDDIEKVMENEDVKFENIECESRVLSDDEVNEVIQKLYFQGKGSTITENLMKSIGVYPIDVYAASKSQTDINSSSYMKKTLVVSQYDDYVKVTFNCTWLKEPLNRMLDYAEIYWEGGTGLTKDTSHPASAVLKYHKSSTERPLFHETTYSEEDITEDYTENLIYNMRTTCTAAAFNMPVDTSETNDNGYFSYGHTNIRFIVSFWIKRAGTYIAVSADYNHQKQYGFNYEYGIPALGKAGLQTISFIFNPSYTKILKICVSIGKMEQMFYVEPYYETTGGEKCFVKYAYK
ncbi:MAG: hypothetical protein E7269_08315 [Lachnospiraceae bacterium]|nr:hypothetical protein [Lachnospiraceae bacterium]